MRRWARAAFVLGSTGLMLTACVDDAPRLRQPPSRSGLLGIATSQPTGPKVRDGRKQIIYDAGGRRDFRQDFKRSDGQKLLFCRLNPGDRDCFNKRL